jgi:CTP:molybdopterin cytidylyltransferase MocA
LEDGAALSVPTYGGRGGHPLWLPKKLFIETLALDPEKGLRVLRQRHPPLFIEVPDREVLHDLDTPEAVAQARTYWGG